MTIPGSADDGTMIADLAHFDLARYRPRLWLRRIRARGSLQPALWHEPRCPWPTGA